MSKELKEAIKYADTLRKRKQLEEYLKTIAEELVFHIEVKFHKKTDVTIKLSPKEGEKIIVTALWS